MPVQRNRPTLPEKAASRATVGKPWTGTIDILYFSFLEDQLLVRTLVGVLHITWYYFCLDERCTRWRGCMHPGRPLAAPGETWARRLSPQGCRFPLSTYAWKAGFSPAPGEWGRFAPGA